MTIGQNIQMLRKEAGLTQKELAEKIVVAPITIQQYERDVREPSFETIEKIATALGVEWIDVFAVDGKREVQKQRKKSDDFTEKESQLLSHFRNLNDNGQTVAVERVQELAQIPAYQRRADTAQSVPGGADDKEPAEK